jgi:hypothetical protein
MTRRVGPQEAAGRPSSDARGNHPADARRPDAPLGLLDRGRLPASKNPNMDPYKIGRRGVTVRLKQPAHPRLRRDAYSVRRGGRRCLCRRDERVIAASEVRHDIIRYPDRICIRVASGFNSDHRSNAGGPVRVKPVNGEHLFAVKKVSVNRRIWLTVPQPPLDNTVGVGEGTVESIHNGGTGVGLLAKPDIDSGIGREHGHRPAARPRWASLTDDGVFTVARLADGFAQAALVRPHVVNACIRPGNRSCRYLCLGWRPNRTAEASHQGKEACQSVESRASANDHGYGSERNQPLTCRSFRTRYRDKGDLGMQKKSKCLPRRGEPAESLKLRTATLKAPWRRDR